MHQSRSTFRVSMAGMRPRRLFRRGFTLLESLMAAGILLVMVVAVTSAITAGQQHAFEAQLRVAGALAAEELLGRVISDQYETLPTWHGFTEPVGTMQDQAGNTLPSVYNRVGRQVHVSWVLHELPGLDINIGGRRVTVRTFDGDGRTLAELDYFVTQPSHETISEDPDDDDDGGGLLGLGIL